MRKHIATNGYVVQNVLMHKVDNSSTIASRKSQAAKVNMPPTTNMCYSGYYYMTLWISSIDRAPEIADLMQIAVSR